MLGHLSPRLSDAAASLSDQYTESANGVKIVTDRGGIDFLVASAVIASTPEAIHVEGVNTLVETPAEILAKKIKYRGYAFTHRDVFDLALLMKEDPGQVEVAIQACGADALAATARAIAIHFPTLRADLPDYVNPTARYRSLIETAPEIVQNFPGVKSSLSASPARRCSRRRR